MPPFRNTSQHVIPPNHMSTATQGLRRGCVPDRWMPHRQNHTKVFHFCPSAQDLFPSGIQNGCVPRADGVSTTQQTTVSPSGMCPRNTAQLVCPFRYAANRYLRYWCVPTEYQNTRCVPTEYQVCPHRISPPNKTPDMRVSPGKPCVPRQAPCGKTPRFGFLVFRRILQPC